MVYKLIDKIIDKIQRVYWISKLGRRVYVNPPLSIDGDVKNIRLGKNITINPFCLFNVDKDAKIVIGNNCRISSGAKLITKGLNVNQIDRRREHVVYGDIILEDNVWIGANSVVIGGVRIGKNSVVAANSFVNEDVPINSVVAGTPAKVMRVLK